MASEQPRDEDDHVRWSDWSQIQQWRKEGKGKYHSAYQRRLKINRLRATEGISKSEAQRRLHNDSNTDIPDWQVDGRPAALEPEVSASD